MLAFFVSVMVLGASVVVADHVADLPHVSQGGELAYVRDCPPANITAGLDGDLECTYFSGTFDNASMITDYTSRGRFGDERMFASMQTPENALAENVSFVRVDTFERGMVTAQSAAGQVTLLNGVNVGLMVHSFESTTMEWVAARGIEAEVIDSNSLELHNDGHTYHMEVVGGTIEILPSNDPIVEVDVDSNGDDVEQIEQPDEGVGPTIVITLEEGGSVRGWLGAFSATSAVMHSEFDHELMDGGLL